MSKTKLHGINYTLADGKRAPSVTTIINDTMGWNKQVLINWAKRQTMEGNDSDAVMRDAADTGTLLHLLIEGHQKGFDVDTKDFTRNQEKAAMIAFGAYLEWLKKSQYTNLASEVALVNEELRVGGTIDSIGKLKDELVLIDWKSSKYGPYKEHKLQISAYIYMYEAAQPKAKVSKGLILRFGKEDGKFHVHTIRRDRVDLCIDAFKKIVDLYYVKNAI
tara:strand:+ start:88 stop:744 length:657 start_codon:yes stop_codon:yes gene_type:complete